MRKLVYIILAFIFVCCLGCSKRTTEYVYKHDTLTIERAVIQQVEVHDTLTITQNTDKDEVRVELDSTGKPKVIVQTKWRDRIITEQGAERTKYIHDTITEQQGAVSTSETITTTPSAFWRWLVYALIACAIGGIALWVTRKK